MSALSLDQIPSAAPVAPEDEIAIWQAGRTRIATVFDLTSSAAAAAVASIIAGGVFSLVGHLHTPAQVGLSQVDNTSDATKAAPGNPVGDKIVSPFFYGDFSSTIPTFAADTPIVGAGGSAVRSYRNSNLSAFDVYNSAYPNVTCADVLNAVLDVQPGTTKLNSAAIGGYASSACPAGPLGQGNAVALMGVARSITNGAAAWALNTLVTDNLTRVAGTATGRTIIGHENDLNITQTGTTVHAYTAGGNSLVPALQSDAYVVNPLGTVNEQPGGPNIPFNNAFWSQDGAALLGLVLGPRNRILRNPDGSFLPKSTVANVKGQEIWLQAFDANGDKRVASIFQDADYTVFRDFADNTWGGILIKKGNLSLDVGQGLFVGTKAIIGGQDTGWAIGTGTPSKVTFDANYTQTISATYSQAQVQAIQDTLRATRQTLLAIQRSIFGGVGTNGLIGT